MASPSDARLVTEIGAELLQAQADAVVAAAEDLLRGRQQINVGELAPILMNLVTVISGLSARITCLEDCTRDTASKMLDMQMATRVRRVIYDENGRPDYAVDELQPPGWAVPVST